MSDPTEAAMQMRALTIWQPWASLVAEGVKTIETRSWPVPAALVGQRIGIHAAARKPVPYGEVGDWCWGSPGFGDDEFWLARIESRDGYTGHPIPEIIGEPMPLGAVVATAVLADCLPVIGPGDEIDLSRPYIARSRERLYEWLEDEPQVEITEQEPYGDFTPGRWGWVLEEIEKLPEPVPARGKQGLWKWENDRA